MVKGGHRKKNKKISSFDAVYKMIQNKTAVLSAVSYSSLTGFVFVLQVVPSNSGKYEDVEFFGIDEKTKMATVPIYSLILKIAIITDRIQSLDVFPLTGKTKKSETIHSYLQESNLQSAIYYNTVFPNGRPVCPAVVDFSYFNTESSIDFLVQLHRMNRNTETTNEFNTSYMLEYLINTVDNYRTNIGVISMELVDESFAPLNKYNFIPEVQKAGYELTLVNLFRVILQTKLVNVDCHNGNLMVDDRGEKCILIDFGRMVSLHYLDERIDERANADITYKNACKILYPDFKNYVASIINADETYLIQHNDTDIFEERVIIERMHSLVRLLAMIDYVHNHIKYNANSPQMLRILEYLHIPRQMNYPMHNGKMEWKTILHNWKIKEDDIFESQKDIYRDIIRKYKQTVGDGQLKYKTQKQLNKPDAMFMIEDDIGKYDRSNIYKENNESDIVPLETPSASELPELPSAFLSNSSSADVPNQPNNSPISNSNSNSKGGLERTEYEVVGERLNSAVPEGSRRSSKKYKKKMKTKKNENIKKNKTRRHRKNKK